MVYLGKHTEQRRLIHQPSTQRGLTIGVTADRQPVIPNWTNDPPDDFQPESHKRKVCLRPLRFSATDHIPQNLQGQQRLEAIVRKSSNDGQ